MVHKTLGIIIVCVLFLLPLNVYSSSIKEDYELQERCGKRCEEWFKNKYGNGIISDNQWSGSQTYHNHYNKKMNKCFIIITGNGFRKSDITLYKTKELLDINEHKDYGYFHTLGTLTICEFLEKKCKSEEEWDLLVKPYMEE